jgi:hypothetical protein|tara:strand:+ start:9275 stop:9580 length:306 start_codon:yes stop_codon:yes gene_type:complete
MLRRPDSIPAGDTVIEDPVMEPFFIAKSTSGGYTVYERVIKGENDTHYIKTVSYPATFNAALKTVSRELLNSKSNYYSTIKEYIQEWKVIEDKMSSLTTID